MWGLFFASLSGRMDAWLGADGKGMMDAFNPADHDLGVQSFGELTREEFEQTIQSYSDIRDTYVLAMPSVTVNGVDFTANVIGQPERFHLLEGRPSTADSEIVVTEFVAADLGVGVGDSLTVGADLGSDTYTISGIYSCANDMGRNIGMSRDAYLKIGSDSPNLWCWHYFLSDPTQKPAIIEALETAYGGDIHIHENTWPGLFGIISAMRILVIFLYGMAALFILVVTAITGSKILAAEQKDRDDRCSRRNTSRRSFYRPLGIRCDEARWNQQFCIRSRYGRYFVPRCVCHPAVCHFGLVRRRKDQKAGSDHVNGGVIYIFLFAISIYVT